jgi:hypothetical protein
VTAEELVAARIVPIWLQPDRIKGDAPADAALIMGQRYRKADGRSLTQFNTGAIIIREARVLAMTECQPFHRDGTVQLAPPSKSWTAVIDDIRTFGPPLLAVLFKKAAMNVAAWVCSTPDEVVLNGPAGPEETAAMEDVRLLRTLPGQMRVWQSAARLYASARADRSLADKLYVESDKLAASAGMTGSATLDMLHRLHRVERLAYALADTTAARP